jgi:hypothetical protein
MRTGARGMTASAAHGLPGWGRVRRVAFFGWAVMLSLLSGILFIGVTVLTIAMWLANQNPYTTPVTDLGFFALGAIIITTGFVVQLRRPEHNIVGLQQAVIGLLALAVAGLTGRRVEPLTGALLFLAATAILVALHPARREFFKIGTRLSPRLAALSLLAAIPATAYAITMLIQARQAGPSCFFGQCAYGDRFAELAALAIAIIIAAMLAAAKPGGWRVTAWSVGAAAAILGAASIALPEVPGALGQGGGGLALAWGVLFIAVAEWEARNTSAPPGLKIPGPS